MPESLKDFCLGRTAQDIDLAFNADWDWASGQIYKDGVYYQLCFNNDVVVDLYMNKGGI